MLQALQRMAPEARKPGRRGPGSRRGFERFSRGAAAQDLCTPGAAGAEAPPVGPGTGHGVPGGGGRAGLSPGAFARATTTRGGERQPTVLRRLYDESVARAQRGCAHSCLVRGWKLVMFKRLVVFAALSVATLPVNLEAQGPRPFPSGWERPW